MADLVEEKGCHTCGLSVRLGSMERGESLACPQCGTVLARNPNTDPQGIAALSTTALIFLVLAHFGGPLIHLNSPAGGSSMRLLDASLSLWKQGLFLLSVIAFFFFVFAPAVLSISLLMVTWCRMLGKRNAASDFFEAIVRLFRSLSMADVFLIGTLVSLIKIGGMAHLKFGFSFWMFGLFVVFVWATDGRVAKVPVMKRQTERDRA